MRIGIGVSTGTEVVCAALVIEEDDGSRTVEYRTVSTDSEVNTDTGDLVESAIELMASLAPVKPGASAHAGERRLPDAIVVSHRTREQATSIRSALARSRWSVSLVPEHAAAYAFLDEAGLIARYRSVLIVDVGAAGTTASVVDTGSGDLLAQDRTAHLSGDVVNRLVKDLVHGSPAPDDAMRDDLRDDRGTGSARYRAVKEHLSTHDSAEVSWPGGASNLDRAAFDTVVRPYVANMAHFTERTAATAEISPEAVVLIGGGANIPIIGVQFEEILAAPVLTPSEPDTILAKGSAHLALNGRTGGYVIAGPGAGSSTRSIGRFSGALVGALVVGGIVVAYGVQTLVPDDRSSVSPAGSAAPTEGQADLPIADGGSVTDTGVRTTAAPDRSAGSAPSYGQPAVTPIDTLPAVTAVPSTTPSLHPAPDLPVIPFPASPQPSREVATVAPRPVTTNPVTTTPVVTPPTDVSTEVPPTESPGESTTPEPTQGGSTELSPPPATPAVDIPTTDVNATTSPGLSPPESVWTPPPLLSEGPRETPRAEPATTTAVTPEG